jgi:tRNA threonylcarbamoyladenosine biosynthesis protein TsaB
MLFDNISRRPADMQVIAVALGPGSWSGLRVGMSIAKGLALAGNLALLGINTLDALAYQHQYAPITVCPLIRLDRTRFATTAFRRDEQWQRLDEYRNLSLAELCAGITAPVLFCGDLEPDVREYLRQELGHHASFPVAAASLRRPGYLAELAWQRFVAGERDELAHLEPLYLGEPVKRKPVIQPAEQAEQDTHPGDQYQEDGED